MIFIQGSYVDLKEIKKSLPPPPSPSQTLKTASIPLKSDAVFKNIAEKISENIEKAKSVNGIFLYNITKDGQIVKKWSELKQFGL